MVECYKLINLSFPAHPSCMSYSSELAKRAQNSPWQCIDCKTCYICNDSNDPVSTIISSQLCSISGADN